MMQGHVEAIEAMQLVELFDASRSGQYLSGFPSDQALVLSLDIASVIWSIYPQAPWAAPRFATPLSWRHRVLSYQFDVNRHRIQLDFEG